MASGTTPETGVTPDELADVMTEHGSPVSVDTIRRACRLGRLAARRTSAGWLIPAAEADAYAATYTRYAGSAWRKARPAETAPSMPARRRRSTPRKGESP